MLGVRDFSGAVKIVIKLLALFLRQSHKINLANPLHDMNGPYIR